MTPFNRHSPQGECEVLDEEAWAVPERLTADDCFDELGTDWRWPSAHVDQEEGV